MGLTANDISAVLQDREGSVWIGLLGSGLARWLGYNEWQSWTTHEGLGRESIWSITRDAAGRLWVGTQFGLNYSYERRPQNDLPGPPGERSGEHAVSSSGSASKSSTDSAPGTIAWRQMKLPGIEMVRSLAAGPDGSLWIGAQPGGLRQLNPKTGQMRHLGTSEGIPEAGIREVFVDRSDRVWIAAQAGLFRSSAPVPFLSQAHFERQTELNPGSSSPESSSNDTEDFLDVTQDRQGRIWASSDHGLLLQTDEHAWKRYTQKQGLQSNTVARLAEDPDGTLWIAYRDADGVTRLTFGKDAANKDDIVRTTHYTTTNGLRSDKVLFLGFDTKGQLWVGTDRGADRFDGSAWMHYGRSDGLIWDDANTNAFYADADGGVWIGTSRGLSRYLPSSMPPKNVPPPVAFTSVKLGGESLEPGSDKSLPYGRNSLQVRFAALTFLQEPSVRFRYRVENLSPEWIETAERELDYPNLPAGRYVLDVEARNAQGLWSVAPARVSFTVSTPWWHAWWFRLASVLVAIALGRLIWIRRTYR